MNSIGTGIFWSTILYVTVILSLATLIGRMWSFLFPPPLQAMARFYLAPVLGLSTLTLVASLIGRFLPMGNSALVPLVTITLLLIALMREQNKGSAFRHALSTTLFGIVCGVSVLVPLFMFGAFNAHNDAFTYLVHGNWLQFHAFNEIITHEAVTPQNSQIAIYQVANLRMGGSFLLAFFQALFHVTWSYEVYPSIVIAALAACFLAMGFPLTRVLGSMHRGNRLMLLALPAFSLGGMVFGANFGFLPQTLGLALGAGFVFTAGPMFLWVSTTRNNNVTIGKAALPMAVLLTGATLAYSEFAPFLLATLVISGCVSAWLFRAWSKMLLHCTLLLGTSMLLLNTELLRAYSALKEQSGAVVGSFVEWSPSGFLAHTLGVHGGAWDVFQWSVPDNNWTLSYFTGLLLLILVTGTVLGWVGFLSKKRSYWALLPTLVLLLFIFSGFLYFRYVVPSPFPKGIGQSWSQFKLTEWAHPFAMVVILFSLASLRAHRKKTLDGMLLILFTITLPYSIKNSISRTIPLMGYYKGVNDLNHFYLEFRNTILSSYPRNKQIYLALGGEHLKFRQMATLYLFDRELTSDWKDDGYIYQLLPLIRRTEKLHYGNLLVEPIVGPNKWLSHGKEIGPFRVGIIDDLSNNISITSITGAYGRESDGKNWWHWVERKVNFTIESFCTSGNSTLTKLRFEYTTRGKQTLRLHIIKRNQSLREYMLKSNGDKLEIFEKVIDISPEDIANITLETDGKATPLGDGDQRVAAWMIRNVTLRSMTN